MAVVDHLHLFFIVLFISYTGSSAEKSWFVKRCDSVQLDVKITEKNITILYWEKEGKTILSYIIILQELITDSSYIDRVFFNNKNFSLTLKNMQKMDSGLYRVKTKAQNDVVMYVAQYSVFVMDPVEAPVLTVNSNWSSSDSCTVNFTCRGHNLTLNSTYNRGSCSPEKVSSHEMNTLILNCTQDSIICNHSNPVSWETDIKDIKELCKENNTTQLLSKTSVHWAYIFVTVCILGIGFFGFLFCKCKKGIKHSGITVYDAVQLQDPMETIRSESHTYDVPDRVKAQTQQETENSRPCTTYCTVGQHQIPSNLLETDHTIYSTVCKQPPKKHPHPTTPKHQMHQ